jgi:hypothetical protein
MTTNTEQPDASHEWAERHPEFVARVPKLFQMFNDAFGPGWPVEEYVTPRMVYGLGLLCWEDFEEILHLCDSGYGFGAEKIIRGMFERLVTATYLHKNPDKSERFIAFEHIRGHKLAAAVQQATGGTGIPGVVVEDLNAKRDAVKETFTRECSEAGCDRRLSMYSWSELDFVSMVGRADSNLKDVVWMAYTLPIAETHASLGAVWARATDRGDGYPEFSSREKKARQKADAVIVLAHSLVLRMFELQLAQFPQLEASLRTAMDGLVEDFKACWAPQGNPATGVNP